VSLWALHQYQIVWCSYRKWSSSTTNHKPKYLFYT